MWWWWWLSLPWEVWVSICFFLVVITLSIASQARKSVTHTLLFNGLTFDVPTKASVDQLVAATHSDDDNSSSIPPIRRGNHSSMTLSSTIQQQLPKHVQDRMALLELESHQVHAGSMFVASASQRDQLWTWRRLDATVSWALAVALGLTLKFLGSWIHDQLFGVSCSNQQQHLILYDGECWRRRYEKHILRSIPSFSISALLTIWWACRLNETTSQSGSVTTSNAPFYLRYAPSSIVTGVLVGWTTLWYLCHPTVSTWLAPNVSSALEELSARLILFTRHFGVQWQEEEVVLDQLVNILRWWLAVSSAVLSTMFSPSITKTLQLLLYRFHAHFHHRSEIAHSNPTSFITLSNRVKGWWRTWMCFLFATAAFIPVFIVLATVFPVLSKNLPPRIVLWWCFIIIMTSIHKQLLQGRLDQALPLTIATLAEKPLLEEDDIRHHFRFSLQSTVQTSSQLVSFPILLIGFLCLRHLCFSSAGVPAMYPVAYGDAFLNAQQSKLVNIWYMGRVAHLGSSVQNDKTMSTPLALPASRARLATDPLASSADMLEGGISSPPQSSLPTTGRELLTMSPPPAHRSLALILKRLQDVAKEKKATVTVQKRKSKRRRVAKNNNADNAKEVRKRSIAEETWNDCRMVAFSLWTHPLVTSTIVEPIMEFIMFLMGCMWTALLIRGLLWDWKPLLMLSNYAVAYSRGKSD